MTAGFSTVLRQLATEHAERAQTLQDAWNRPGTVAEVTSEVYDEFFEMLPPRFVYGSAFGFAEGEAPWTVFWRKGTRSFARQLTPGETESLMRLLAEPQGS